MYKLIILLSLIICGITRGISEGMIMEYGNIRDHKWFKQYHKIDLLSYLFVILCTAYVVMYAREFTEWRNILYFLGSCLWSWQGFETAYAMTRFQIILPNQENFFGLGLYYRRVGVIMWTLLRTVSGLTLVIIGLA